MVAAGAAPRPRGEPGDCASTISSVAELLGERAPLDTAVRTSRELPALGTAAGMEQGLAAAADDFSARLAGAVALLVHQIEQTSDRVHAAMTAYAAQDTASAAQLDDVTRQLG